MHDIKGGNTCHKTTYILYVFRNGAKKKLKVAFSLHSARLNEELEGS